MMRMLPAGTTKLMSRRTTWSSKAKDTRSKTTAGGVTSATPSVHDFRSFALEHANPFCNGGEPRVHVLRIAQPECHARDLEQRRDLIVRQLCQQPGEKRAPGVADYRVLQGTSCRPGEVADAAGVAFPDRGRRPGGEVHALAVGIDQAAASKGQPDIVDHHQRPRTGAGGAWVVLEALDALLLGFTVGVLEEDSQELQRVAVGRRRATACLLHVVELGPWPGAVRFELLARHLALDRRRVEQRAAVAPQDAGEVFRTAAADDTHRVHAICAKTEGPEQAGCRHLGVHLCVAAAELDLQVVARRGARELRRTAGEVLVHVIARHGFT